MTARFGSVTRCGRGRSGEKIPTGSRAAASFASSPGVTNAPIYVKGERRAFAGYVFARDEEDQ
jgi:hypothetical protein